MAETRTNIGDGNRARPGRAQGDTVQSDTARVDTARVDTALDGTTQHGTTQHGTTQGDTTQGHTTRVDTAQDLDPAEPTDTTHDAVVRVRGLCKRYGSHAAVDGVSFDIRRGETFALLGPNGAGKSTTIEILTGYRAASGGDVEVLGVDPAHGTLAWRSRLGIVLQSGGEADNVTVRELLSEFAGYYPHPRDVDEVLDAVGLAGQHKTRIGRLSGGQRRRVDVALGIIGRPELLFLDEPTTGFDPEARRRFWDLIRTLHGEGTSILLTTHYLDEAAQLSDRAAVIAGGRLADIGPVDQIGGRDARVPIVKWTDAAGRRQQERTDEPGRLVAALMARAESEGASDAEPRNLEILRPTLEDVYLDLIREQEDAA